MSPELFACFLLAYGFLQTNRASATVVTIATTYTGLEGDYNLGHSGYVYLQSDAELPELKLSTCPYYDVNRTTCSLADKSPKTDGDVSVLRAWTALTLRDNVLVLLGYLAHQPKRTFSRDTRSALRLLYEEVRRNGVRSMDLLPRMKTMAKTSRFSQVLALLKALRNVAPSFCRSAVDEVERDFARRRHLLKSIIEAPKGVDLFADIGLRVVPLLRVKSTRRNYDRNVEAMMGKEFAVFFEAIRDGRIVLSQPVLAALMLNMKFDELSADGTEDLRFFCDILRANRIPDWSPGFSGSCCGNFKDPYALVETTMTTIVERSKVDDAIKILVVGLLRRLFRSDKPSLNSERMNRFFVDSNFNVSLFVETLRDEARIPEFAVFRRMIYKGTINIAYALKGFVRYFYDTPKKIVLAFVERIKHRVPMSGEAKIHVDAILSHLRGERASSKMAIDSNFSSLKSKPPSMTSLSRMDFTSDKWRRS